MLKLDSLRAGFLLVVSFVHPADFCCHIQLNTMAWTTALVLVLGMAAHGVCGSSYLTPLANYVKSQSDPNVPPQKDINTPVQVSFAYATMNIAEVDKEHNTYLTENFVGTGWDTGITWNPADYGGADRITLPKKYFWIPHLYATNTAIEVKDLSPGLVILFANGTASYNQLYKPQGLCDVSNIEQGASCSGGSTMWGYSMDQVNIKSIGGAPTDVIPFFEGSKYMITGAGLAFTSLEFDNKHYQIVTGTMEMKAKPGASQGPVNLHFDFH